MKISDNAIEKMSNAEGRRALMNALEVSEFWTRKLLVKNKSNGPLTTAIALTVIKKVTGLRQDQILEREDKDLKYI